MTPDRDAVPIPARSFPAKLAKQSPDRLPHRRDGGLPDAVAHAVAATCPRREVASVRRRTVPLYDDRRLPNVRRYLTVRRHADELIHHYRRETVSLSVVRGLERPTA